MSKNVFRSKMCQIAGNVRKELKRRAGRILKGEEGMGTVEVILIILVLIGLVIIFKSQLTGLVESIFGKITSQAGSI